MRKHMVLLLALPLLPACATVMSGRHQKVAIQSEPPGAQVTVDGHAAGKTPLVTKLTRGGRHEITVHREGYLDDTRMTGEGFNWWFAGNVLIGGLIGMVTDMATGAAYCVDPDSIQVRLLEAPGSTMSSPARDHGSYPEALEPPAAEPGDDSAGKGER